MKKTPDEVKSQKDHDEHTETKKDHMTWAKSYQLSRLLDLKTREKVSNSRSSNYLYKVDLLMLCKMVIFILLPN